MVTICESERRASVLSKDPAPMRFLLLIVETHGTLYSIDS